jgi:hypothetical protein
MPRSAALNSTSAHHSTIASKTRMHYSCTLPPCIFHALPPCPCMFMPSTIYVTCTHQHAWVCLSTPLLLEPIFPFSTFHIKATVASTYPHTPHWFFESFSSSPVSLLQYYCPPVCVVAHQLSPYLQQLFSHHFAPLFFRTTTFLISRLHMVALILFLCHHVYFLAIITSLFNSLATLFWVLPWLLFRSGNQSVTCRPQDRQCPENILSTEAR